MSISYPKAFAFLSFLYHALLIVCVGAAAGIVKEHCHPEDKRALLAINRSFNNRFSSWNPNNDCCRYWAGVKCDPYSHRVSELSILGVDGIPSSYLSGVIPDAVGDLSGLTLLRFHKLMSITGTIPSSISKLQNLSFADFSWNSLSGPVPTFFHHMRSLGTLDLSFNRFSGSLPPQLALGPSIGSIDISRNMISGPIPHAFGYVRNSGMWLLLSHNMITGAIPKSLENARFANIDFSRNQLTGNAAFLFRNASSLQTMNLSRNKFSFNMSNLELDSATSLTTLDVSHNEIFGSLPSSLATLPNLQFFNVSYNRLCGKIPIGGQMSSFDQTSYIHNKCLCGSPLHVCE